MTKNSFKTSKELRIKSIFQPSREAVITSAPFVIFQRLSDIYKHVWYECYGCSLTNDGIIF